MKRPTTQRRPVRGTTRQRRGGSRGGLVIPDCKHFTGYKPCFPGSTCYKGCVDPQRIGKKILIINLDAMGNVLVTTTLLPALKRKYPVSSIYWITLKNAAPLLENNPYLERIFLWEAESWLVLQTMTFDVVLNVDKSQRSGAFAMSLRAKQKLGFGINANGVIVPLNKAARRNYILGLDDHMKFHVNDRTVSELQCEEFELKFRRDEYVLHLSDDEERFCREYRRDRGLLAGPDGKVPLVVGLNTGCSDLYPNKKMTIDQHVALIGRLSARNDLKLVLLGGVEDTLRNAEIARRTEGKVLNTPTHEGLRRGLCYVNACDLVITGDSFGMHAALGLKKHLIVWFGVTCSVEVDLFERGVKLVPAGLACSPCWKRECPYGLECIQMIDMDAIVREVERVAGTGFRTGE
jgi:ADP-heptose:LPS heptosyltransferase